jgi:type VI secretion system secreted protein Hcp
MAAVDYFLKLDGITGESRDAVNKGSVDISSFSWGVSQNAPAGGAGGGGRTGRAVFQPMRFVATTTSASAALLLACAAGTHIKTATLTVRKSADDGTATPAETYDLFDCIVSEYFVGGPGDDTTGGDVDTFSLSFSKVQVQYFKQDATGKVGSPAKAGWDLATNKKA